MSEQLSGMDSAFLSLESDEAPMHVVGVLLLDPAKGEDFSVKGLRQVISDRLHLLPPFCRRLVQVPLALDKPYWQVEHDVDLSEHLFDAKVAEPGDMRALGDLVGEIAQQRLDRSMPLWQLHIATGLADGRVALVAKVHHCTMYGAAGAEFIAALLDLTPEIAETPAPTRGDTVETPSRLRLVRSAATTQLGTPVAAGRLMLRAARGGVGTVRALRGAIGHFGRSALPPQPARTPISGSPTAARSTAFATLPLDAVREVKSAAGVTVNDVVLAVVAMAVGRYLHRRDSLPDRPLVAGVPVNAGGGEVSGTNRLATMMVSLPVDIVEPAELLAAVHENSLAAKAFTAAIGSASIAELADLTTPALLSSVTWLTRSLGMATVTPTMFNLVVSNMMGPPIPLYLAGAGVDAIVPMGPLLAGSGMNVTVLSNLDRLDIGILACPDLVEDVWEIADDLAGCLEELRAAP